MAEKDPNGGTVALIDPRDNRIYSVSADKADLYRQAGWGAVDAGPRVNAEQIHQSLSGWADNSQAIAFTVAKGVPLGVKLLSSTMNANAFQRLAAKAQIFDEDHPILSPAIQVGTGIGTFLATGPLIRGAGAILGGATEAGSIAGLGGEAYSAAGYGAEAAGAAGSAAEGLGTAASSAAQAASPGTALARQAATAAGEGSAAPGETALTRYLTGSEPKISAAAEEAGGVRYGPGVEPEELGRFTGSGEGVSASGERVYQMGRSAGTPEPPSRIFNMGPSQTSLAVRGETGMARYGAAAEEGSAWGEGQAELAAPGKLYRGPNTSAAGAEDLVYHVGEDGVIYAVPKAGFRMGPSNTGLAVRGEQGLARYGGSETGLARVGEQGLVKAEAGETALARRGDTFRDNFDPSITDAEFSEIPIAEKAAAAAGEATGAAEGAAKGASSAAAEAAAGAGETAKTGDTLSDLLTRAGTRIKASKLAKAAAIGAGTNAAYGLAYKIDAQAIDHALDPKGQEKLLFNANDVLFDAAVGAAIPVGAAGLGKSIGWAGKKLTDNSIEMFRNAMLKNSSLDQIVAQGREGTLASTLDPFMGKSQEYVYTATKAAQETAEQQMDIIKAKYKGRNNEPGLILTADEKTAILDNMKKILGTDRDPLWNQTYATVVKPNVDLLELQKLAKKLSKKIVWRDPKFADNVTNLKYRDARQVIADAQVAMLERADVTMAGDAQNWKALNQISSDNQLINDALRSRRGQDVNDLMRGMGSSAAAGAIAGALGANGAGIAASALRAGSWAGVHNIKAQHLAPFAKALGSAMLKVDGKIAKGIEAGLYGFPSQAHVATAPFRYDDAAAAISLAGQDPSKTIERLQNHLDAQGVPQEISVPIAQAQAAGLAHLAQSIPTRNDAPDMATRDQGDPVQQHRWMDQVRTFQDPTYGIAHPTADNMRILKQFYPQTLYGSQQALYEQIANNPDLPAESRMWGSQLLERPIGNLDSPTFAQTLRQARSAQEKQAQQGGGGPKRSSGGGSSNGVQSSETRVDQLQNRD